MICCVPVLLVQGDVLPEAKKDQELMQQLVKNNPFVPLKTLDVPSNLNSTSDFEFNSHVVYPTYTEFSLREKASGESFWLNSNGAKVNENKGLTVRNYDPKTHTLILQENATGNFFSLNQEKQGGAPSDTNSRYDKGSGMFDLLSDWDDDEEPAIGKR